MTKPTDCQPFDEKEQSQQEQAAVIAARLSDLLGKLTNLEESGADKRVPEVLFGLVADTRSIAEGIRDGWISTSQPRMATNLLRVLDILELMGHDEILASTSHLLTTLSSKGLAAEHCSLGRGRRNRPAGTIGR